MLDLLLLSPIVAVLAAAAVVVRRERRREPALAGEDDPVVDLAFLRAAPREIDLRIAQLREGAQGSLGARMRSVQLAHEAEHRPVVRPRRRRERPLVAAR